MSRFMVIPYGEGYSLHDDLGEYDFDQFLFLTREFADGFCDSWNSQWELFSKSLDTDDPVWYNG